MSDEAPNRESSASPAHPHTGLPVPKYRIGDTVWVPSWTREQKKYPCPDCLGASAWPVMTPGGTPIEVACIRCNPGFSSNDKVPPLSYTEWEPTASPITIGSIEAKTHSDSYGDNVSYMTSTSGSGSIYYESRCFETREAALQSAQFHCNGLNDKEKAKPERIETQRLAALPIKEAMLDQFKNGYWDSWWAYRRLSSDLQDMLDGDEMPSALKDVLDDKLRFEREYMGGHILDKLINAARDYVTVSAEAGFPALDLEAALKAIPSFSLTGPQQREVSPTPAEPTASLQGSSQ